MTWWYELFLPRFGLRAVAERTRIRRMQHFARKYRVLAVDLGGLMIKLGQYMSSRLDVLPPEFTAELEGLQDEVPPVAFDQVRALAEDQLGVPLERVFASITTEPIAAASLGQAYRARLGPEDAARTGFEDVVVKVQRPGIRAIVEIDLAALRRVAKWLSRVRLVYTRVDMPALMEEFGATSFEEIDYLNEASNAEKFAHNFADNPHVRTPAIVWERSTREVLTLQDVSAIKIGDTDGLREAGIDPAEVANVFASLMFDQFFVHGFFHADPHPGNLFVTPAAADSDGPAWAITFIDFGMMGTIPDRLRASLRKLIVAAAGRDGRGIVAAMDEAGVLLPSANRRDMERIMTQVFARFGGMGFAELRQVDPKEFQDFALEFSDTILTLPFQLPSNFLLLMRASSLTSGVCSGLYPPFNLWDSVEPYAGRLLRDEAGNLVTEVAKNAWEVAGTAWRLPGRIDATLDRIEDGTLEVSSPRLERLAARTERTTRRILWAVVFAALLVAGAMLYSSAPVWGTVVMVSSAVPLAAALFARRI